MTTHLMLRSLGLAGADFPAVWLTYPEFMIVRVYQQRSWAVRLLGLTALLVAAVSSTSAQTTDDVAGQVKKIEVVISGVEKDQRRNILGMLDLWEFHEKRIPSVARMRFMHNQAVSQIQSALRPFGYYRASVESELVDLGSRWQAVYRIEPGDRVLVTSDPAISLGDVEVECDDIRYKPYNRKSLLPDIKVEDDQFNKHKKLVLAFCGARNVAALRKGVPLDQQAYDALKQSLQTAASRLGYFDAEFTKHEIRIDIEAYTAEIILQMDPGERYRIGRAIITQDLDWISDELLERYVELEDQDYFDAGKLQSLQSDLSNSEYYKGVEVKASAEDAEGLVVPVQVDLTHILPRAYVVGAGYGTDTGARIKVGVTGRRVNRRGHHYVAEGRLSQIGYGLGAAYTVPTGDPRTDSYGVSFNIDRIDSAEKDSFSVGLGANYQYRDGFWFKTFALDYQVDKFTVGDDTKTTTLLMPSLEWTRTYPAELEKRINVINGTWLKLVLRGASDSLVSDTSFFQPQLSLKWINSFENRHRLLARAKVATTWVKDFDKLPLSLRYYAGGDNSVRGYDFEEISPVDDDNEALGGKHLLESSVEYEIPFKDNFSWAVFSDLGDAFNDKPDYRLGVGVGLRWRSPIGPVRLDLGRSLKSAGKRDFRFHLSVGPDL